LSLILIYVISGQVSVVIWRKRSLSPWQRDALFFYARSCSFHKSPPHAPVSSVSCLQDAMWLFISFRATDSAHFTPSRNYEFKYVGTPGIILSISECNLCSSI